MAMRWLVPDFEYRSHCSAVIPIAGCRLQPLVTLAIDHVARCADAFPEQPGLVVENSGVTRAARPPQPDFQLPYVADLQRFASLEPVQAHSRRNSRVVDRPGHETDHSAPVTREIDDLQHCKDAVALELRRQPQAHYVQRM
jgi:hypothetical protein